MSNIYIKYANILCSNRNSQYLKILRIDIKQLMINHDTYNIAEQYVGHVRTRLCGHAPRDRQSKIIYLL